MVNLRASWNRFSPAVSEDVWRTKTAVAQIRALADAGLLAEAGEAS